MNSILYLAIEMKARKMAKAWSDLSDDDNNGNNNIYSNHTMSTFRSMRKKKKPMTYSMINYDPKKILEVDSQKCLKSYNTFEYIPIVLPQPPYDKVDKSMYFNF